MSEQETEPVKLAANTLLSDFEATMGFRPTITNTMSDDVDIVILNDESRNLLTDNLDLRALDGPESHRVWAGNNDLPKTNILQTL